MTTKQTVPNKYVVAEDDFKELGCDPVKIVTKSYLLSRGCTLIVTKSSTTHCV